MLNCVLGREDRQGCVNHRPGKHPYGKCSLGHVLGCMVNGEEHCDQYKEKEEPRRCEVCNLEVGKVRDDACYLVDPRSGQTVLCVRCYEIYDSLIHGKHRSYGHVAAMDMLEMLVVRERENK